MMKVKVRWAGFNGAPGWSNFFFDTVDGSFHSSADAAAAVARVRTFFNAVKVRIPSHVTMTIQPDVEVVSAATGEMTDVYGVAAEPAIAGTAAAASYSAASGMVINWRTAGVRNGRRVRGRTFLVPIAGGAYQSDGTIEPGNLTETAAAASAFVTTASPVKLGVWARPVKDQLGAVTAPGEFHQVTSATVPDLAAVLRSRRG
jgi:hypothetical protein